MCEPEGLWRCVLSLAYVSSCAMGSAFDRLLLLRVCLTPTAQPIRSHTRGPRGPRCLSTHGTVLWTRPVAACPLGV